MGFVNCARNEQEQNLEIFQYNGHIYYRAAKDIPPDQELLVWYGGAYLMFLGIPGVPPVNDYRRKRRTIEGEDIPDCKYMPSFCIILKWDGFALLRIRPNEIAQQTSHDIHCNILTI